jgi:hypothetical protein
MSVKGTDRLASHPVTTGPYEVSLALPGTACIRVIVFRVSLTPPSMNESQSSLCPHSILMEAHTASVPS